MRSKLILSLLAGVWVASGATTYSGTFSMDDEVRWFSLTLAAPGTVTVRSAGYGGDAGLSIAAGGFDTTLSLFDAAPPQFLLAANDDGGCPGVSADPVTGSCWDALLSIALPAGQYLVALTQYENTANGPTLADGFTRTGTGNYTSGVSGYPGEPFVDLTGSVRTGNWTLIFDGADTVTAVPEPATVELFGIALLGVQLRVAWLGSRRRAGGPA